LGEIAIEVKGSARIDGKDMNGLQDFVKECPSGRSIFFLTNLLKCCKFALVMQIYRENK